jgi:hypothetical protein
LLDSAKRDGSGWIEELRRTAGPSGTPQRVQVELKNTEAARQRLLKQLAAAAARPQGQSDKDRKKLEVQLKELDARLALVRAELARAEARPAVDFDRVIEDVFLRTVSRLPTAEEMQKAREDLNAAPDKITGVRELLWAMLNTREFMVNH